MLSCICQEENCKMREEEEIKRLMSLDINNIQKTQFNGMKIIARVVDIYDGDTITIAFFPSYHNEKTPYVCSFRLFGYDAPEMKPNLHMENRELHMKAGEKVKDLVKKKLLGNIVDVEFSKKSEKFGREMGQIYINKNCFNEWIISNKLGKPYHGEKKGEFTEDDLNHIINFTCED